jgi:hypothetical protein
MQSPKLKTFDAEKNARPNRLPLPRPEEPSRSVLKHKNKKGPCYSQGPLCLLAPHECQKHEILIAHEFTFDRPRYTKSGKSANKKGPGKHA